MTGDMRMFTEMNKEGCSTYDSITLVTITKERLKVWVKLLFQMITLFQMYS
jgi:hypothetical protein